MNLAVHLLVWFALLAAVAYYVARRRRWLVIHASNSERYTVIRSQEVSADDREGVRAVLDVALDDALSQLAGTVALRCREGRPMAPSYKLHLIVDSSFALPVPAWEVVFQEAWQRFLPRWERMGHEAFWAYTTAECNWNTSTVCVEYRSDYVVTLHATQSA